MKISIPREAVTQIMADYNCSEEAAAKAYLDAQDQANIQISETLKKFLFGVSALNYMGVRGPYKITKEMIADDKYFDKLFAGWYENEKKKSVEYSKIFIRF